MTKIGIMSFAHMHAYSYAASLVALDSAELTAVWDDDGDRGKAAATDFNTKFIADMDAFLDSGIDGVIITSENVKHRDMVEKAAAAGKWILCEKPLATTIEDAQAMVDACKTAGVGLGTAFPCRYASPLLDVKRRLDAGEFGTIYAASCTNNGSYPGGWFSDEALSGGGATMDHTVHVADALRWLLGREITKVYCEKGNLTRPGIGTDDVGSVHMEMESGIIVSHIASWDRAKTFPTWGDVTIELIGEKGVVHVDGFMQKINVYDDAEGKAYWVGWGDNPDTGLVADFLRSVEEKNDPAVTGIDGLRAVEVTVAAYQSAERHEMVSIGA